MGQQLPPDHHKFYAYPYRDAYWDYYEIHCPADTEMMSVKLTVDSTLDAEVFLIGTLPLNFSRITGKWGQTIYLFYCCLQYPLQGFALF